MITAGSTSEAGTLSEAWQWPIDLTKYDRPLIFTEQELQDLNDVVHRPRFPLTLPPTLTQILQPVTTVLAMNAKKVLLIEMHRRQRPFWTWTREDWTEILGRTWHIFVARYPKMPMCRQQVLTVGYLLCGYTDFHLLGGFTRESLANVTFGQRRMESIIQRVHEGMCLWGYANQRDLAVSSATREALLLNRSPSLENLTYDFLLLMRERTETLAIKRAVGKLSCALMGLGLLNRTLPHVPLPPEKKAQPIRHLLDGTPTVAQEWLSFCQRWYTTSTLTQKVRYKYYCLLLQVGRWLTQQHPDYVHPQTWTREFAARAVAFVNQLQLGQWIEPENTWRIPSDQMGKPLSPRSKALIFTALRALFFDCQEWEWIPRRFDPGRALATPRSLLSLIGPDPRILEDDVWAKLLWAGLNLTQDDIEARTHPRYKDQEKRYISYPLEMVQAMTLVWLFCGIRSDEWSRLRVGCIRWQQEDLPLPWTQEVLPKNTVCLLHIPIHKTGTAFTKPVDRVVGEAIMAWEKVRPTQPPQIDPKTGEEAHFLFSHRGQCVAKLYINDHLIPMLCKKSGVPTRDARGNITSHRARSTIATQLFNAPEPMSLFELQEWLGHRSPGSTQQYAKISPTRLAKSKAKAEYFERNLRLIDVLIDQDAIKSGAAADGQPWRYYDLGHGLCTYDFFDTCLHRMACAKCSFYVPKGSSLEQVMEGKANLLRMKQELSLTEEEAAAVDDGLVALDALHQKLADVPTPAGPTPRQLGDALQQTAFISVQTVQRKASKE